MLGDPDQPMLEPTRPGRAGTAPNGCSWHLGDRQYYRNPTVLAKIITTLT